MSSRSRNQLSSLRSTIPIRLTLSYILDWIVIVGIAAVGAAFWTKPPNHHPFSPVDPSLSYPYVENNKIPTWLLVLISLIAPAIITMILALTLTSPPSSSSPSPSTSTSTHRSPSSRWRWHLWEWNTAWMGLALGLALTFLFTEGMKVAFGKPRPDLLARCNFDPAKIPEFALGGYGTRLPEYNVLVSWTICDQSPENEGRLRDGFQSFPSGHASFSWAGMVYLSLYLCSKLCISIPYLLPSSSSPTPSSSTNQPSTTSSPAAPPTTLLIPALIPLAIATYVSSTRYSDFRHHGFDILFGAIMGALFSYFAFRYYHPSLTRGGGRGGAGLTWRPRSATRAFWLGPGKNGGWNDGTAILEDGEQARAKRRDIESGVDGAGTRGKRRGQEHSSEATTTVMKDQYDGPAADSSSTNGIVAAPAAPAAPAVGRVQSNGGPGTSAV